jgi:nucleotide-binding universal stress UspA family protein
MPAIPGTRQAAPSVYGEEGLLIDAVLPAEADLGGPEVWVSLRGWHILAPPQPRLLVCDLPDEGSPAPFPLVQALEGPLNARVCLLGVTEDADGVEPLRARLTEEAVAGGVPDAEAVARRGGPAAEITAEQRQSLYDFTLLQFPAGGRVETLMGLLESLPAPLLVSQGKPETFRRILICTAVGEPGKADVRVGGWLARRLGAEVTLLHVLPEGATAAPWVNAHLNAGLATLRALEVPSRSAVRPARTAMQGILAEAREGQSDLIVLGRHARQPGERSLRHDVTLQILADSTKSVLIVPPDE